MHILKKIKEIFTPKTSALDPRFDKINNNFNAIEWPSPSRLPNGERYIDIVSFQREVEKLYTKVDIDMIEFNYDKKMAIEKFKYLVAGKMIDKLIEDDIISFHYESLKHSPYGKKTCYAMLEVLKKRE